jgi:hypothetical protein
MLVLSLEKTVNLISSLPVKLLLLWRMHVFTRLLKRVFTITSPHAIAGTLIELAGG